jgi:hypothetical protein
VLSHSIGKRNSVFTSLAIQLHYEGYADCFNEWLEVAKEPERLRNDRGDLLSELLRVAEADASASASVQLSDSHAGSSVPIVDVEENAFADSSVPIVDAEIVTAPPLETVGAEVEVGAMGAPRFPQILGAAEAAPVQVWAPSTVL